MCLVKGNRILRLGSMYMYAGGMSEMQSVMHRRTMLKGLNQSLYPGDHG